MRRGRLRDRLPLDGRLGAATGANLSAPVRQPCVPHDRAEPILDEHPRHPVRGQGDAPRGRRDNPRTINRCRHGIRHKPALRPQALRLQRARSAHRMDRPSRLKSGDGPHLSGDAAIRDPAAALLLAPLQVAGPAAPARGLALPQTQRPPATELIVIPKKSNAAPHRL